MITAWMTGEVGSMIEALRSCMLRCAVVLAGAIAAAPAVAQGGSLVVFAAASLKTALDAVNSQWQAETGRRAAISYAATPALARQIEHGAPAQMFLSADLEWMAYLAAKGLIKPGTRLDLLGNRLVLIAPRDQARAIEMKRGLDLAALLGEGRLAMANVDAVPAGRYGKAALEALGLWAGVAGRTAQAENVRAALLLVSRGEAPLGIVYHTDAAADPNVAIVATFPQDTHPPIIYPIALTTAATADAAAFLAFVTSAKAKAVFEAHGFTVLSPARS